LNALTLTGQTLLGQPVMVKASEAEKNLAWEAQQQQQQNQAAAAALLGTNLSASGPCKLYVAGLHPDINVRLYRFFVAGAEMWSPARRPQEDLPAIRGA